MHLEITDIQCQYQIREIKYSWMNGKLKKVHQVILNCTVWGVNHQLYSKL